ncbi:von Willebrand factor A domain-containing protein 5A-like isoform X2 [Thalassophryne amazonica]|uniref:von Willebrand factor A domain-containing protein 5A-like isoform X2 n=1 Tax=Thalassophryne amazonica TaxID=390379 RepID=UPI001471983F|nr:von Willebrand factor A domain-containing protein 5A-like isoform X2 [Thalassophryne amazonica]
MQSLRFALQPTITDLSVKWNLPRGAAVTVLSPPITAIFQGQRSIIYGQLTGENLEAAEGCVTVKYTLAGHLTENKQHFSLKPAEDTGLTVHRLGARTLIRSLEMEVKSDGQQAEGVKEKVVGVSVQSGVSSAFTAFIAVNKGNGETVQGPLMRRHVPAPSMMGMAGLRMHAACPPMALRCGPPSHLILRGACGPPAPFMAMNACGPPAPFMAMNEVESLEEEEVPRDPLLQLVSLQKASGSWVMEPALAAVLGKTIEEVEKQKPAQVTQEVWATILALIWLHGFKMDARVEWELLVMKAVSWLRAQKAPCGAEFVEAGNALLGCKVQKDSLGI